MGVDAAVFESAGKRSEHYIPGAFTRSNNVSSPSGISASNMVILGKCAGGIPKKLLTFTSLSEAKDVLLEGELLDAVGYAFNNSVDFIPSRVNVMRVNDGTPSALTLGSIKITSNIYSAKGNMIKAKIENGTNGDTYRKVTVAFGDKETVIDNIKRVSLTIKGPASSTVEVTSEKVTIKSGSTVELPFTTYRTLAELVSKINDTTGFTATLEDYTSGALSSELDKLTSTSCSTKVELCSTCQAIIEECSKIDLVSKVELTGDRSIPTSSSTYSYFSDGADGNYNIEEWEKTLTALEVENIQIITTPSTESDVQNVISAHCVAMNSINARKERTCILGAVMNETTDNLIANAKGFNSKFTSFVGDSASVVNSFTGKQENISGGMVAVMLAAMESAAAINEPLTFKQLNVLGFTKLRTSGEIERLIQAGVLVCNPNPENPNENIVIRAITTYQGRNDLISCERSMVREDLYMNRDLRNRFSLAIGRPNEGSTDEIVQTLKDAAKDWARQGYIIPKGSDNVWDISVRIDGDKVYLTFSRYLTAPRNFVFITATNHIYTATIQL